MAKGSSTFGASVKVDGEKEFKQALESINAGLKVNGSELQKLTAQYASSGSSVEALTKKQEALESKLSSQQEKVDTLRKALNSAAVDYGESDKRTMAWQVSLNKAEAELFKLNDELSNNQKALDESKTTTDGLTYSNEQLTNSITDQQSKIDELKKGLADNAKQYGENDQRTLYFKDALNKAQSELDGMNKELSNNEKALKGADEKTGSLGDSVRGLANAAGLEIPPALQGMVTKLDGVSKSGAALATVLGGIVFSLYKATERTTEAAGKIDELSHKTGMSTDKIQELNYAAEYLEVSAEDIGSSIAKMTKNMDSARKGSGDAAEAFKKLHVSIKTGNGQLKDSETVFYNTIDALGKIKNETDRDALSMAIFGKSAMSLNNLILEGSDGIKGYAEEARKMGYILNNDAINNFNVLDDSMVKWNKVLEATSNSMATALIPILTALFEAISKIPAPVLQSIIVITGTVASILLLVKTIKEVTSLGGDVKNFFTGFDFAANKTKLIILGVVAGLVAILGLIAVLTNKSGEVEKTFSSINGSVNKINGQVNNASTKGAYNRIPAYAKGTNNHPGGRALVGEYGPEIVDLPRGSRVYPNGVYPSGGDTYIIENLMIEARTIQEFNDVYRMVKNQRRMGVQGVTG
ncbi:MAG: hypothetical protein E7L17_13135 [Clostridium sp.]|uniref:hypothetical protein n=1 Tax=Clostridium sp. TaxID=1506 RepID=UPI0029103F80|nr:hypothetical protein [Clostridium sp.]MDU7339046.1 hypothetical protein [Clostridium sp.]